MQFERAPQVDESSTQHGIKLVLQEGVCIMASQACTVCSMGIALPDLQDVKDWLRICT